MKRGGLVSKNKKIMSCFNSDGIYALRAQILTERCDMLVVGMGMRCRSYVFCIEKQEMGSCNGSFLLSLANHGSKFPFHRMDCLRMGRT